MKKFILVLLVVMLMLGFASLSLATGTGGYADLFAAADVSGLQAAVLAILLGFVGIMGIFVGYRFLKKTMNRA